MFEFGMGDLITLITLTSLEIVLGIDNIIFMNILIDKLPKHQHKTARRAGIAMALVSRILLLMGISWVMGLTKPLVEFMTMSISGKDIILMLGGGFLVFKAMLELTHKMSYKLHTKAQQSGKNGAFIMVVLQIAMMDIIFSLDSVITAVGMSQNLPVMIMAVLISMGVMVMASEIVAQFIEKHKQLQVLGLGILVAIGVVLMGEGAGYHMSKVPLYVAVAFALIIDIIQIRVHKAEELKHQHEEYKEA